MRSVIQRVSRAAVTVDGCEVGAISSGLLVLAGIEQADTDQDLSWTADKIVNLRIFEDGQGKMNLSVGEIGGGILLVPNFTVAGNAQKGRRPSFDSAMPPTQAEPMFDRFVEAVSLAAAGEGRSIPIATGVFRAAMEVSLVNDGPVTIVISSRAMSE